MEEAVLALEAAFALADERREEENGGAGDFDDEDGNGVALLPGQWRLIYTTALDVAPLLAASEAATKPSSVGMTQTSIRLVGAWMART